MLALSKSLIAIFIGYVLSTCLGIIIIPFFKKIGFFQSVSRSLNERHLAKDGTPTMGGIIFIIPSLLVMFILIYMHKIHCNISIMMILMTYMAYGIIGLIDDLLKIKYHNNKGLSIRAKFLFEFIIALLFYFFFIWMGNNTQISFLSWQIDVHYLYGSLILFLLEGTTNAVNITDGLDGLCGGISVIAFAAYGIIAWKSFYIIGNEEIALFCFTMVGCLLGFLLFNFYPAKIFMGDFGSLALGGALASIAILLKKELSLGIIGFVFALETLSSMIQIISIKKFKKKILYKSPLHHHFEEIGMVESDIIKIFYMIAIVCSLIALIYYT